MLKQGLQQKLQTKLSPLQIQTIKLLELPTLELEQCIKKEIEENPVLDEAEPQQGDEDEKRNISLSDYSPDDPTPSYKLYVNNQGKDLKPQYNTFSVKESFHQNLEMQLGYRDLDKRTRSIARYFIQAQHRDISRGAGEDSGNDSGVRARRCGRQESAGVPYPAIESKKGNEGTGKRTCHTRRLFR